MPTVPPWQKWAYDTLTQLSQRPDDWDGDGASAPAPAAIAEARAVVDLIGDVERPTCIGVSPMGGVFLRWFDKRLGRNQWLEWLLLEMELSGTGWIAVFRNEPNVESMQFEVEIADTPRIEGLVRRWTVFRDEAIEDIGG